MQTNEIFSFIMGQAGVKSEEFEQPYDAIKQQLRYYREDIPSAPRYKFDVDAVYFYHCDEKIKAVSDEKKRRDFAERGDIMTSLWTPFTYCLKLNKSSVIKKNNANIDRILDFIDTDETKTKKVLELIQYLSQHYVSRGNLLLLPNTGDRYNKRNMNPDKYVESEDKLDQFLYSCFDGKLQCYFLYNPDHIAEWIVSEHLECMFASSFFECSMEEILSNAVQIRLEKSELNKSNLQSLIGDPKRIATYKYSELKDDEWSMYFERLSKVIAYRNTVGIKPHFPFEWNTP